MSARLSDHDPDHDSPWYSDGCLLSCQHFLLSTFRLFVSSYMRTLNTAEQSHINTVPHSGWHFTNYCWWQRAAPLTDSFKWRKAWISRLLIEILDIVFAWNTESHPRHLDEDISFGWLHNHVLHLDPVCNIIRSDFAKETKENNEIIMNRKIWKTIYLLVYLPSLNYLWILPVVLLGVDW